MLAVNFKPIAGNCAPVKQASETETKHATEVASSVISKLQEIAVLNDDENGLLNFVKLVNPELSSKFAGCSDSEKAKQQFSHLAIVGEKRIYSIFTAPKTLDDVLMNLASTRTLYRAVKIETAKAEKAAENETFAAFIAKKNLPASVMEIAGVKEQLITQWFEYLRNLQVSEGSIRDLCTASKIDYQAPQASTEQETETETETETATETETETATETETETATETETETEGKPKQQRKQRKNSRKQSR